MLLSFVSVACKNLTAITPPFHSIQLPICICFCLAISIASILFWLLISSSNASLTLHSLSYFILFGCCVWFSPSTVCSVYIHIGIWTHKLVINSFCLHYNSLFFSTFFISCFISSVVGCCFFHVKLKLIILIYLYKIQISVWCVCVIMCVTNISFCLCDCVTATNFAKPRKEEKKMTTKLQDNHKINK